MTDLYSPRLNTLVLTPIQLRYLESFLLMYVLPRAGSPTITITCGVEVQLLFTPGDRLVKLGG